MTTFAGSSGKAASVTTPGTFTPCLADVTPETKGRYAKQRTASRLAYVLRRQLREAGDDPDQNHTPWEFLRKVQEFCAKWNLPSADIESIFVNRWDNAEQKTSFWSAKERLSLDPSRVELPDKMDQCSHEVKEQLRTLLTGCIHLQGNRRRFFLSSKKAGELIGLGKTMGAERMKNLVGAGVLVRISVGGYNAEKGCTEASVYEIGEATSNVDRTHISIHKTQNTKPTPQTRARASEAVHEAEAVLEKPRGGEESLLEPPLEPTPSKVGMLHQACEAEKRTAPSKAEQPPPPEAQAPPPSRPSRRPSTGEAEPIGTIIGSVIEGVQPPTPETPTPWFDGGGEGKNGEEQPPFDDTAEPASRASEPQSTGVKLSIFEPWKRTPSNPEPWRDAPRELRGLFHTLLNSQHYLSHAENWDEAVRLFRCPQRHPEGDFSRAWWLRTKQLEKAAPATKNSRLTEVVWEHLHPDESMQEKWQEQITKLFDEEGCELVRDAAVDLLRDGEGVNHPVSTLASRVAKLKRKGHTCSHGRVPVEA